jgi:glycerol-3-phosphate dehydrogenase
MADIDYILEHVNEVLSVPITHADITGVYAGLRPLLSGEEESTSQLSREHAVARPMPGVIAVAGGKYTTYRPMAADAVDAVAEDVTRHVPPSVTEDIPLVGAEGYKAMVNSLDALSERWGIPRFAAEHLLNRFGSLTPEVLALADDEPALLQPVPGAEEYLMVEMVYAASHEGALHLDDLLARRTRISIETPHRGVDSAEPVARAVAGVLGWDAERTASEVDSYRARVEAERRSQEASDDQAADAVRVAAPDTRAVAVGRALA